MNLSDTANLKIINGDYCCIITKTDKNKARKLM